MKKGLKLFAVLAALIILVLTGCGKGGGNAADQVGTGSGAAASEQVSSESGVAVSEQVSTGSDSTFSEKDIIKEEDPDDTGTGPSAEAKTENAESSPDKENGTAEEVKEESQADEAHEEDGARIPENATPTGKDELAAYIHEYGHLPDNFITKKEAKELGWSNKKGNLWDVAYGYSIGGDYYSNYEGTLPEAPGREYYECDVDYNGGFRNAKRIVFSNDGLIFYTGDHYETFELLYGEEQ